MTDGSRRAGAEPEAHSSEVSPSAARTCRNGCHSLSASGTVPAQETDLGLRTQLKTVRMRRMRRRTLPWSLCCWCIQRPVLEFWTEEKKNIYLWVFGNTKHTTYKYPNTSTLYTHSLGGKHTHTHRKKTPHTFRTTWKENTQFKGHKNKRRQQNIKRKSTKTSCANARHTQAHLHLFFFRCRVGSLNTFFCQTKCAPLSLLWNKQ